MSSKHFEFSLAIFSQIVLLMSPRLKKIISTKIKIIFLGLTLKSHIHGGVGSCTRFIGIAKPSEVWIVLAGYCQVWLLHCTGSVQLANGKCDCQVQFLLWSRDCFGSLLTWKLVNHRITAIPCRLIILSIVWK